MRRLLQTLSAVLALSVLAVPLQAQVNFGVNGSVITAVDDVTIGEGTYGLSGTYGVGGRLIVDPPAMPLTFVGSGDYYFVDCPTGAECSLYTLQGHATLGLPFPMVRPYVLAGMQYRSDEGGSSTGAVAGAGLQLNLGLSLFLEGQFELGDAINVAEGETPDVGTPFVIKGGIIF